MATGGTQAPWASRAHSAKAAASGGLFGLLSGGPAGAIIGAALGLGESIWSAKRADSAHQREVRDLQRAGLNPMLSARGGGGSEVGDVGGASRGITSGLAAQRARAEIELLRAQTKATLSQSMESMARVGQIETEVPSRVRQMEAGASLSEAQTAVARMSEKELKARVPLVAKQMLASISSLKASASSAVATKELNEVEAQLRSADLKGRMNREEIQKFIGELPVWARVLWLSFLEVR